jgi:hypothetical protein
MPRITAVISLVIFSGNQPIAAGKISAFAKRLLLGSFISSSLPLTINPF